MKIAVVGAGSVGKRHLGNLIALGHEASVVEPDPKAAAEAKSRFGTPVFPRLEEALEQKPRCVFIATPPALHLGPALEAARAGCDLFIEKPLSHSWDGVETLIQEARRKNLVTMVGCNMRFHPNIAFMKRFIGEGRLGEIYSVRAEFGSYLPGWRPGTDYRRNYGARKDLGGGVLLDHIHELDYLRWLGGEIAQAGALASTVALDIETEDVAVALLRFAHGALGTIHFDYLQRSYARNCKWVGEKGELSWDWPGAKEGVVRFYDNSKGGWEELHRLPEGYDVNEMFVEELKAFLSAVETRRPAPSSLEEGAQVLRLALACKKVSVQPQEDPCPA